VNVSDSEIARIIGAVDARLGAVRAAGPTDAERIRKNPPPGQSRERQAGVFEDMDRAVAAAHGAFEAFRELGLDTRRRIVEAMRAACRREGERLAYEAHRETGLGRAEHKAIKNRLVTERTPGPEDLEPQTVTGDDGMTITEYAPFGVVGSITPTTNPTSTIINNSIAILSAGNALTFNPHPNARAVSADNIAVLNHAIVEAGGPDNLITTVSEPTLDTAKGLMRHPDVALLLVTGGPGVVAEALRTNKRAVTAGPGNPPAVVDETADIERAGGDIVYGASFDNNVICTDEKTTIVVDAVAGRLIRAMEQSGCRLLKAHELRKLERKLFPDGMQAGKRNAVNPDWIGKNANCILAGIGIRADDDLKLVLADVPNDHPLVWSEQLMPVMPVTRVRHVDAAIDLAVRSEHGYRHTASIHSSNVATITRMARAMNCSIFVANGPNVAGLGAGGEGFTSFSIASPTGEGMTRPRMFSRVRRVTVVGALRIV
jgi:acyl-CoA reductase-like NAD-dependent aldehyde dehydrogenase